MSRPASGFTLVEVLTALAITGLVALLAHRLMGVTVDGVRSLQSARMSQDRRENGRRWLRSAFLSLQPDGPGGFGGDQDRVRFTAWLEQPEGWFAPRRVALAIAGAGLRARLPDGSEIVLIDSVIGLEVDDLLQPGADTRWVRQWHSPLSAPLALRLRILRDGGAGVDTILCLIRERG